MSKLTISARLENFGRRIRLYGFAERQGQSSGHANQLTFRPDIEGQVAESFAALDATEAQALMDDLWTCGVRPTEAAGSAGQAAAMQRHIDDLRAVLFTTLKVKR
jgi:hypothetical protein